jgi:hypothetical protein
MELEEIIINLKLLQKIEKGQKLITRDAYLNIETGYLFIPEGIRRWKRQDNRNEMIKTVNRVINDAITHIKKDGMNEYLCKTKMGIMNLKETYSACHQTCARLDMILDKIKVYDIVEPDMDECF